MPRPLLTTWMEPWGFIKPSLQNKAVHMELSLCLSFQLRHSLGGYMVGTTTGFHVETVEAPIVTYEYLFCLPLSTHYRGLVPRVLLVFDYGPKFWIQLVPSSSKRLGDHTPRTGYSPTTHG
jgi:hypothetical protein